MTRLRNAVSVLPSDGGRRYGLDLSTPLAVFTDGLTGLLGANDLWEIGVRLKLP